MGYLGLGIDASQLIAALTQLQADLIGPPIGAALMTGMKATQRLIVTPSTWQQGNARYNYRQSGRTWEMFQSEEPMHILSGGGKASVMVGWGNVEQRFIKLKRPEQTARFEDGRVMKLKPEKELPTWVIMEYGVSGKEVHANIQGIRNLSSMGIDFQRANSRHYTPSHMPGDIGESKMIYPNIVRGRDHPGVWPGGGFSRSLKLTQGIYYAAIGQALLAMMP